MKRYILYEEVYIVCRGAAVTVDGADLVAHGVADELVAEVVHDEDLVHAELLGGDSDPAGLVVGAALEQHRLPPLEGPGLRGPVGHPQRVVPGGGGRDDCAEKHTGSELRGHSFWPSTNP